MQQLSNLKVALIEVRIPGGQMNNTSDIENYPGYANISGPDLVEKCLSLLENLGVGTFVGLGRAYRRPRSNQKIVTDDGEFEVKTVGDWRTGFNHRSLNVPVKRS